MLGYNAISRYDCLGLDFDDFGSIFSTLAPLLESLLAPQHHFGALWMHFSRQKTDWGAKGVPKGPTPEIHASIWAPVGEHCSHVFVFLMEKCVLDTRRFFPQF